MFEPSKAPVEPEACCTTVHSCNTLVLMNPGDLFTSKKGPAELSLQSLISCCLVFSSGQRLGSLDSNGSIAYRQTHTHTHND